MRYKNQSNEKKAGETFTPPALADFVASKILQRYSCEQKDVIKILEPAVGDGELLLSLLKQINLPPKRLSVTAYDISSSSLEKAKKRLSENFPDVIIDFRCCNFLDSYQSLAESRDLFTPKDDYEKFDIAIANPPYVRTQIIGSENSTSLAKKFDLQGRIDLYQAFIVAIFSALKTNGCFGAIVSNRFLTTKSGSATRKFLLENTSLDEVWDLGDTKLFDAAVLPALIFGSKRNVRNKTATFSSIYQSKINTKLQVQDIFSALSDNNVSDFETVDGIKYHIERGILDTTNMSAAKPWAISNAAILTWLEKVNHNTKLTFGDVAKIRVGIKSCADKVFLRKDWEKIEDGKVELLFPLLTRKHLSRFTADDKQTDDRYVLYPYDMKCSSRKPVDLDKFPFSKKYLMSHKAKLSSRTYMEEAGRKWYELWVPHNPINWKNHKVVFPDISETPVFYLDCSGAIVSGECYWLTLNEEVNQDYLYLILGVANSRFIEKFYDANFSNKLYSGKRRFITQYVSKFPLPDIKTSTSKLIVQTVKEILSSKDADRKRELEFAVDEYVEKAFSVSS